MKQVCSKYIARLLIGLVIICALLRPEIATSSVNSQEYPLKAAFIYNFIKFTNWPLADTDKTNAKPLFLMVAGPNNFGDTLQPLTQKKIAGRQIILLDNFATIKWHENEPATEPFPHVIFVSLPKPEQFIPIISAVKTKSVLTISDAVDFAKHGGCIELRLQNGKIRFIINKTAIEQHGIKLSYKVYDLALEIVGGD